MRFECSAPILRVENMETSVRFYVDVLGFENASWGTGDFTQMTRDDATLYLSRGCTALGAMIRLPPTSYPCALEMHVDDPDGNVLRIGSDPT